MHNYYLILEMICLSKRCSKCGATNFDSATICVNCGSLFKDGAYSPDFKKKRRFKKPYDEVIHLEKSSKIIIAAIVSIIVIIAVIAIICIVSLNGKKADDKADASDFSAVAQQEATDAQGNRIIGSASAGDLKDFYDSDSAGSVEYVEITKITAAEKEVKMKPGDTKELSVSLTPTNPFSKYVSWSSDNENIVRLVEDTRELSCDVEAVSEGSATITISAMGAGNALISETITITVIDADKLVRPTQTTDYGEYYVTANDFLSLRNGPSTDYNEVMRLSRNEIVRVYAKQSDEKGDYWFYVYYQGNEGWALGRFLEEYHIDD